MSTHNDTANAAPPLDLSKWRNVPNVLMVLGGIGAIAGCFRNSHQLGFSWLLAFMFFLSLCLGSLGL